MARVLAAASWALLPQALRPSGRRRLDRMPPLPAASSGGAPVEAADLPEVHEPGEEEQDEEQDLEIARPAQSSCVDRPREDEDGLQVEDHKEQRDLVEPVSYTHLTLPTIYSV